MYKNVVGPTKAPFATSNIHNITTFWRWLGDYTDVLFEDSSTNGTYLHSFMEVIGGVVVIQRIGGVHTCDKPFLGQKVCYDGKISSTSPAVLPSTAASTRVPYSDDFHGYVIFLQSGWSSGRVAAALKAQQTGKYMSEVSRQVKIRAPLYAANVAAIGVLDMVVEWSTSGLWTIRPRHVFLPYDMYHGTAARARGALEILFLIYFAFHVFFLTREVLRIYGVWTPKVLGVCDGVQPFFLQVVKLKHYTHIHLLFAVLTSVIMMVQIFLWWVILREYSDLHSMSDNIHNEETTHQLTKELFDIVDIWHWYYVLSALNCIAMTFRIFQFLHFQGKLNAVTMVFEQEFGEFANFFVVVAIITLGFGFAIMILLGSQYSYLNSYKKSSSKAFQFVVSLWKPSESEHYETHEEATELLVFAFKLIVVMILLKMLVAIVFSSYKKNRVIHKTASSVGEDFAVMFEQLKLCVFTRDTRKVWPSEMVEIMESIRGFHNQYMTETEFAALLASDRQWRKWSDSVPWIVAAYGMDASSVQQPPATEMSSEMSKLLKEVEGLDTRNVCMLRAFIKAMAEDPHDPF